LPDADLDLIRACTAALDRGDFDEVANIFSVDAELQRVGGFGVIRGREAIRSWLAPDALELLGAELVDLRRVGEHVLATCTVRFRGAGSGVEMATTFYLVFRFEGGHATRLAIFLEEADALAATSD
jgi:hypothetical protein